MDKVKCRRCGRDVSLRKNGTLRVHGPRDGEPCAFSGSSVEVATASFCTQGVQGTPQRYCVAIDCDAQVTEPGAYRCDDHLCARGTNCLDCWEGGVEPVSDREHCAPGKCTGCCGCSSMCAETPCERGYVSDLAPTVDTVDDIVIEDRDGGRLVIPAVLVQGSPGPKDSAPDDLFEDPTKSRRTARDLVVKGRYHIVDPRTGDHHRYKNGNVKGFSRTTTFIKYAQDSKALNDWGKRNILIGAAKRPDVAARAFNKNHNDHKAELDLLVEELSEIAGAKVSSGVGVDLHSYREELDQGRITLDDISPVYRRQFQLYLDALSAKRLTPVAGLTERVTMVTEFDGVAGQLDGIYLHEPSGQYLIGDQKSGKTTEYGKKEWRGQLWIYAHGFNQNGVYDPETDTWERPVDPEGRPIVVSETKGVVFWTPVDGDHAGTVQVLDVDLEIGRQYAELCHTNRSFPAPAFPEFNGFEGDPDVAGVSRKEATWAERFASVTSNESATTLWQEAKIAGITGIALDELIQIARQAIRGKG